MPRTHHPPTASIGSPLSANLKQWCRDWLAGSAPPDPPTLRSCTIWTDLYGQTTRRWLGFGEVLVRKGSRYSGLPSPAPDLAEPKKDEDEDNHDHAHQNDDLADHVGKD